MFKKISLVVLALVLAVIPAVPVSAFSGSGIGSAGNPFVINTCQQIFEINSNLSAHYVLAGDVDCAAATWGHIGTIATSGFSGTFDGQGYTVRNLTVNDTNGVGLFTYVNGGTISNIALDNFDVTGTGTVGALVAQAANATISQARVSNSFIRSEYGAGGLVGVMSNSTLTDSSVLSTLVTGRVGDSTSSVMGGMVGQSTSNTYARDFVSGTVNGEVSGTTSVDFTGGFIGSSNGDVVTDSYTTANVTGRLSSGGFVGTSASSTFTRTYASGTVIGTTNVGGFNGSSALSMHTDSFAIGSVTGVTNVGGLIGRVQAIGGDVTNSTWDVTRTGQADCVGLDQGISYSSVCMTGINVASGMPNYFFNTTSNEPVDSWDFSTVWQTTTTLPTLRMAPGRADNVSVVRAAETLRVRWEPSAEANGSTVTSYELKVRPESSSTYSAVTGITPASVMEYTIGSLVPSTNYIVEIRAQSSRGPGTWTGFITSTTAATPVVASVISTLKSFTTTTTTDTEVSEDVVGTTTETPVDDAPAVVTDTKVDDTPAPASSGISPILVTVIVVVVLGGAIIVIRLIVRK